MNATQKRILIVNSIIVLITIVALIASLFGWFTQSSGSASISGVTADVEGVHINIEGDTFLLKLPCATDLSDPAITGALFNTHDVVTRTYTLHNEGSKAVSFTMAALDVNTNAGLISYVCSSTAVTDYFSELSALFPPNRVDWTFAALKAAVNTSNRGRSFSIPAGGSVSVKMVFWADYREVDDKLNAGGLPYWDSEAASADQYRVQVIFDPTIVG